MGENCNVKVDGNKLVITVDMTQRLRRSASGKTTIVATTGGNMALPNGLKVGLNVYAPNGAG